MRLYVVKKERNYGFIKKRTEKKFSVPLLMIKLKFDAFDEQRTCRSNGNSCNGSG